MPARDYYPPTARFNPDDTLETVLRTILVGGGGIPVPMSGGRYYRQAPAPTDKRVGVLFPRHTASERFRGNWQDDSGEWQSPRATEQIADEIMADLASGLLEERGLDRCPTCGQPLPAQAAATDGGRL